MTIVNHPDVATDLHWYSDTERDIVLRSKTQLKFDSVAHAARHCMEQLSDSERPSAWLVTNDGRNIGYAEIASLYHGPVDMPVADR